MDGLSEVEAGVTILERGGRVRVDWPDGRAQQISALWLFDHVEAARDPVSGQRRHGALTLDRVRVESAQVMGDHLVLDFGDGLQRLALARLRDGADRDRPALAPWLLGQALADAPSFRFDAYLHDDDALAAVLRGVVRRGLVLLTGAGEDPQAVERAVARFGFVRETNYGRLFDVRAEPAPINLAFTERALDLHTDNPYRDPVPTLQLLHAIRTDPAGEGATYFVDGFAHAEALRRQAPAAFAALAGEAARFSFAEASGARWSAAWPILQTAPDGALLAVRLNHRALDLAPCEAERQDAWYAAYLDLYRRVHAPESAFEHRLAPGEMVIFDNRRILHGRRAFQRGGARWLRGAYADVDGLHATLARLS